MASNALTSPEQVKNMFTALLLDIDDEKQDNEQMETQIGSFHPQSRKAFMERSKTFSNLTWAAKPVDLSPLQCARYGWRNSGSDELRCVSCHETIYAGLPDDWNCSSYVDFCNKTKSELVNNHSKECPWPSNPCAESFLYLPSSSRERWRLLLKDAFSGLVALGGDLPAIDSTWDDFREMSEQKYVTELYTLANHLPQNEIEFIWCKSAAILALTGWNVSKPGMGDLSIECHFCNRQIGLWNFLNLNNNTFTKNDSKSFSDEIQTDESMLKSVETPQSDTEDGSSSHQSWKGFAEPNQPPPTHQNSNLMRDLLFNPVPSPHGTYSRCGESIISEVGSDLFDKRVENTIDDLSIDSHVADPAPPPAPTLKEQHLMKELLFLTAPKTCSPPGSESVISDIGSSVFDRRIGSTINSPRAGTPVAESENELCDQAYGHSERKTSEVEAKKMRLEGDMKPNAFHVINEHFAWCPWVIFDQSDSQSTRSRPGYSRVALSLLPNPPPPQLQELRESPNLAWKSVSKILKDCYSPGEERPRFL